MTQELSYLDCLKAELLMNLEELTFIELILRQHIQLFLILCVRDVGEVEIIVGLFKLLQDGHLLQETHTELMQLCGLHPATAWVSEMIE